MSLTNDQLEERVLAIEAKLNQMQLAINNLASKKTMNALTQIRQAEIESLKQRVADLEEQLVTIQAAL